MQFTVLDSRIDADRAAWLSAWEASPNRSPFVHPTHAELFSSDGEVPRAAHLTALDGTQVLYVFICRPIPNFSGSSRDKFDTVTPYGYGGAYVWGPGDRNETARTFWAHFDSWAAENHIVSEFIRFDVLESHLLPYPGEMVARGCNVVRSLDGSSDERWMDYEQKVRKNVSKARRAGVTVVVDQSGDRLDDFMRIYNATMDRRGAGAEYLFLRSHFERTVQEMPGQSVFFHAVLAQEIVSTEMVLVSAEATFSFLGGTDSSHYNVRPNDLLKHEIIEWSADRGKDSFVLGGGASTGDGIERYKRAFAPGGSTGFSTGQRVLDKDEYEGLTRAHNAATVRADEENRSSSQYFPSYRSKPA